MPLLPMYSFEIMQKELFALYKGLEALKGKILSEDDFKKMNERIERINKEIRSARF